MLRSPCSPKFGSQSNKGPVSSTTPRGSPGVVNAAQSRIADTETLKMIFCIFHIEDFDIPLQISLGFDHVDRSWMYLPWCPVQKKGQLSRSRKAFPVLACSPATCRKFLINRVEPSPCVKFLKLYCCVRSSRLGRSAPSSFLEGSAGAARSQPQTVAFNMMHPGGPPRPPPPPLPGVPPPPSPLENEAAIEERVRHSALSLVAHFSRAVCHTLVYLVPPRFFMLCIS
jgi:hypothetical protein